MRTDLTDRLFRARSLFVLSIVFIAYATTIPWDFAPPPSLDRIRWVPFWDADRERIAGIPDIVQNVLLFLPFGFFGWIAWTRARRWDLIASAFFVGCAGGLLSLVVEILQTMSPTRTPSTSDLITNWTGSLLGALAGAYWTIRLAPRWEPRLRRTVAERPGLLVCAAVFGAIAYDSLMPFYPTLDVGHVKDMVKALLRDPWGPKNFLTLIPDMLLYVALAALCAMEVPAWRESLTRRRSRHPPAVQGFCVAAVAAIALEAAQLVFQGHSPSLQDVFAGVAGAAFGGVLAHQWGCAPAKKLGDLVRRVPREAIAFGLLLPLTDALVPFEFMPMGDAFGELEASQFIPFRALFVNINIYTFFNVFAAAVAFLPLGYSLAACGWSPLRLAGVCALWGVATEIIQIPVEGRSLDTAVGLYAAIMALLGQWMLRQSERMLQRASFPHAR